MDPGGTKGAMAPPALYKQVIKKMAAKGGHIDFMFLVPPTQPLDPMLKLTCHLCEGAHFICEIRAGARIFGGVKVFCYTGEENRIVYESLYCCRTKINRTELRLWQKEIQWLRFLSIISHHKYGVVRWRTLDQCFVLCVNIMASNIYTHNIPICGFYWHLV